METNVLQFFASKSPPSAISIHTGPSKLSTTTITVQTQIFLPRRGRSLGLNSTNGDDKPQPAPPTVTPPDTVEIRFKRRSRRPARQQKEDGVGGGTAVKAKISDPPKKWEDKSLTEKAVDIYIGEKGLLFWLNKFAYASIFIVIGGWIMFRFVGPALNLYQLDAPPLSPSNMFKGS